MPDSRKQHAGGQPRMLTNAAQTTISPSFPGLFYAEGRTKTELGSSSRSSHGADGSASPAAGGRGDPSRRIAGLSRVAWTLGDQDETVEPGLRLCGGYWRMAADVDRAARGDVYSEAND
jgi:hypothetical protein